MNETEASSLIENNDLPDVKKHEDVSYFTDGAKNTIKLPGLKQ